MTKKPASNQSNEDFEEEQAAKAFTRQTRRGGYLIHVNDEESSYLTAVAGNVKWDYARFPVRQTRRLKTRAEQKLLNYGFIRRKPVEQIKAERKALEQDYGDDPEAYHHYNEFKLTKVGEHFVGMMIASGAYTPE